MIETKRLYLRKMTQEDFADLRKHLQDPEVMYAYEHPFSDIEIREGIDKQLQRYEEDGFGVLAVILKESGELIGQCGLAMQPCEDLKLPEIGYIFQKEYWGNGYATEAATACKKYAFEELGIKEVYSLIKEDNIASQNVAMRNGMTVVGRFTKDYSGIAVPHLIFSVKKSGAEYD